MGGGGGRDFPSFGLRSSLASLTNEARGSKAFFLSGREDVTKKVR